MTATLEREQDLNQPVPAGRRRAARRSARSRLKALRPRRPGQQFPIAVTTFAGMLLTLSILTLWFIVFAVFLSGFQERRNNAAAYSVLRQGLSEATTPFTGVIPGGTPIGLLQAPVQGLRHTVLVEGTSSSDLTSGPGHQRDTPMPGQVGTSVLMGRSLTYGAPFGHIDRLRPGQTFTITTAQGTFSYRVEEVRRVGDPLPTQLPDGGSRIVFRTSTGSRLTPSHDLFVDALLTSKAVAGTPAATSLPSAETAWRGDHSQLPMLVLWVQAVAIAITVALVAKYRWGARQSWLIGTPLVLAALWGATSNALLLLPNLV